MGKVSLADKMQIQTWREQRLGAKTIMYAYPDKGWALSTVKKICQRVDQMGLQQNAKLAVVSQNLRALKQTLLLSFFNAEKLVGGHDKKSIISSFFNRITFHLAVRCRTFPKINL